MTYITKTGKALYRVNSNFSIWTNTANARQRLFKLQPFLKISLILLIISVPIAVYAQDTPRAVGYGITSGRAKALLGVAMSLTSVIISGLALSNSKSRINNKGVQTKAIVALVFGLVGIILSLVHFSNSTGGFGTGGGRAGAILAFLLGLTGVVLSGLSLTRYRRNAKRSTNYPPGHQTI